ncbi:hypothetical protein JCM19233_942 [Vibrio astriarenae]|nr:hypothetical protein JCM19233_942 [Vibrio sp. C7]
MVQVVRQKWLKIQTILLLSLCGVFVHANEIQLDESTQRVILGLPTDILNFDMQGQALLNDLDLDNRAVTVQAQYIELIGKSGGDAIVLS